MKIKNFKIFEKIRIFFFQKSQNFQKSAIEGGIWGEELPTGRRRRPEKINIDMASCGMILEVPSEILYAP